MFHRGDAGSAGPQIDLFSRSHVMRRVLQRLVLLAICAVAHAGVSLPASTSLAQTGNWEYVPALGGYLDWDTGLVWGEQRGISTWNGAVANFGRLSDSTGVPWRMPTVAESQVATAHGIYGVPGVFYRASSCWTSDAKNKGGARTAHYAFFFHSGTAYLASNNSLNDSIPVYRAFTP
jgi:hypothetical protein